MPGELLLTMAGIVHLDGHHPHPLEHPLASHCAMWRKRHLKWGFPQNQVLPLPLINHLGTWPKGCMIQPGQWDKRTSTFSAGPEEALCSSRVLLESRA